MPTEETRVFRAKYLTYAVGTRPGRVDQVSWIRLRSLFASWRAPSSASSNASFADSRMPVILA